MQRLWQPGWYGIPIRKSSSSSMKLGLLEVIKEKPQAQSFSACRENNPPPFLVGRLAVDKVPYDRSSDQDVYRIRKGHGCRSKKWTAWKSRIFFRIILPGASGSDRRYRREKGDEEIHQDVALLEVPDKKELTDMDIPPDIS